MHKSETEAKRAKRKKGSLTKQNAFYAKQKRNDAKNSESKHRRMPLSPTTSVVKPVCFFLSAPTPASAQIKSWRSTTFKLFDF